MTPRIKLPWIVVVGVLLVSGGASIGLDGFAAEEATDGQDSREIEPGVQYPRRVEVPEDIPSTLEVPPLRGKLPDGAFIFPVAIYSVQHFWGWQECLREFCEVRRSVDELRWKPELKPRFEPYSERAHRDGFEDCRQQLAELVEEFSEATVRASSRPALREALSISAPSRPEGTR